MNIIIIEDEELSAKRLESMILKYDESVNILAKLESIEDSIDWLANNPEPDLIFLDIHLDDGLSFSIFEKVKVNSSIIFTTAFDEYAIKAFKLKSIDYLLKPIVQDDLVKSIEKFKSMNSSSAINIDMKSIISILSGAVNNSFKERFSIIIGQTIKTIYIDEIAYFTSEAGTTILITNDKHKYPVDISLEELGEQVNPKLFFRINRQFLVKLKAIKSINVFPKSRLKLDLIPPCDKEVYVSIDKVTKFKDWLDS
jgi:DNA-binding LytR/AlgR family response regulator